VRSSAVLDEEARRRFIGLLAPASVETATRP